MEHHLIAAIAVLAILVIFIGTPMLVGKILDWLLQRLTKGKYGVSSWRTFLWTWVVIANIALWTATFTGELKIYGNRVLLFLALFVLFPVSRKKP